jgi:glycosyltransferase involved in cell wall biosynthesis
MLERYDVIHSTMSFLPPVRNARTIVTVHDLIPLARPDISLLSTEKAKLISRSVQRADLVIADSEHSKCDITKYLDIAPSKVSVIYPGVDPIFESDVAESTVKKTMNKYSIDFPYLLFVGNIDPRKNLARLIRAFGKFASRRDCREKLLLVGGITHRSAEVLSIITELGLQNRVLHLGYVPRADMPALFLRAEIFVFPSIYEGFGFPVLEAMSCGVPVITSNTSSLPEIAGDAAYYVSPDSVESISDALDIVSSNARLRKEMTRKGRVRASHFRWEDTARQTVECYRKVSRA